jgi:hypothetical protein
LAAMSSFDPNSGWFGLANTYANQFVSSGFPINLLSYLAQNSSARAWRRGRRPWHRPEGWVR